MGYAQVAHRVDDGIGIAGVEPIVPGLFHPFGAQRITRARVSVFDTSKLHSSVADGTA